MRVYCTGHTTKSLKTATIRKAIAWHDHQTTHANDSKTDTLRETRLQRHKARATLKHNFRPERERETMVATSVFSIPLPSLGLLCL